MGGFFIAAGLQSLSRGAGSKIAKCLQNPLPGHLARVIAAAFKDINHYTHAAR